MTERGSPAAPSTAGNTLGEVPNMTTTETHRVSVTPHLYARGRDNLVFDLEAGSVLYECAECREDFARASFNGAAGTVYSMCPMCRRAQSLRHLRKRALSVSCRWCLVGAGAPCQALVSERPRRAPHSVRVFDGANP